ncbi:MAG: histidine--tRNA ligase [Spartobacteria bacterium]|nr:histidine--tRNA ligase [Spartobacteria bacterium]
MASDQVLPVKGMSDLASPEIELWQHLESTARGVFSRYDLGEVRTPVLEREALFVRSLGDTTDVVQKEMFTLDYQGKLRLTLRPEGTAGAIRYISSCGQEGLSKRIYYIGPMFRAERPQAGRRRQFHQTGAELLGDPNALADAECIAMQVHLLEEWGLKRCRVQINTRGTVQEREAVAQGLRDALNPSFDDLCEDCQRRFEQNVLRVLDCKNPSCQTIVAALPNVVTFMSDDSQAYFKEVQHMLELLDVPYTVNPRLVRGLDYYEHTVWEISHDALGAQDALSGGGRYSIPVEKKAVNGVGFAIGMERIQTALAGEGILPEQFAGKPDVFLVSLGDAALKENMRTAQQWRRDGLACALHTTARSMKAQMRAADRSGAAWVVIRGDNELSEGACQLKNLSAGEQSAVSIDAVPGLIR